VAFDVGDAPTLSTTVTDVAGTPTDATMALAVTKPDGTTASPSITHGGTGVYTAVVTVDQAGTWFYTWTASGAVVAVDAGQFAVVSPRPLAYATVTDLRSWLRLTDASVSLDSELADSLEAASRDIDDDTDRRFWLDQTASARTFNPRSRIISTNEGDRFTVDDIGSAAGIVVEVGAGTDFTTVTGYEPGPDNAIARGVPITWFLRPYLPWVFWPLHRVRVTAHWGWPQVPAQIKQATLLRAARLFRRRDTPEGVAGFNDMGVVRLGRYDPDYDRLVAPFKQPSVGG
jgi:hypothetical protein